MYEELLKTALFGALLAFAVPLAAEAQTELLVGNIRDTAGNPLRGASVSARDAQGKLVGHDLTAPNGTFAIVPAAPPVQLVVECDYCRTVRVSVGHTSNFAIVVLRYSALVSGVPSAGDLGALPYVRPADVLGMIPYTMPSLDGRNVSDRGLQRGHGLVLDDGAPVYDLATGESALIDFPGRYLQQIDAIDPSKAFRYGSYAGGGTFALDQLGDATLLSGDVGQPSTLTLEPRFGAFAPATGISDEDGLVQRRADFDAVTPFAGGQLRAGITAASDVATPGPDDAYRNIQLARLSYATVSRNYVTSLAATAADWSETNGLANSSDTSGSETNFNARIERPNAVSVAAGVNLTQQTGYLQATLTAPTLAGRVTTETAYLEAHDDAPAAGFSAGLGLANVAQSDSAYPTNSSGSELVLLPSLEVHAALGFFALRAGVSDSLRAPTLLEAYAARSNALERGNLLDAALSFDDRRRLHVEAIAFQEYLHGAASQRTTGLGASLVWQIAPLLSLRFWTLNDSPLLLTTPYYRFPDDVPTGRQVLWTTYAIPDGIRFDAILRRDVLNGGPISVDGDVVLPITGPLSAVAGTSRLNGSQLYSFGFRVR